MAPGAVEARKTGQKAQEAAGELEVQGVGLTASASCNRRLHEPVANGELNQRCGPGGTSTVVTVIPGATANKGGFEVSSRTRQRTLCTFCCGYVGSMTE